MKILYNSVPCNLTALNKYSVHIWAPYTYATVCEYSIKFLNDSIRIYKNVIFFRKNMAVIHWFFTDTQFTANHRGELFGFTEFLCKYCIYILFFYRFVSQCYKLTCL